MKNHLKTEYLPCLILGLGGVGCLLRLCLDLFGTDEKGLLVALHPLEILLWILTAGAAALIAWSVFRTPAQPLTAPKVIPAAGALVFAVGVLIVVLGMEVFTPLESVCRILGFAAAAALLYGGVCHLRGREPFFLAGAVESLFLGVHMVSAYRHWSGEPQLLKVVFSAAGLMLLALTAYYQAARQVGLAKEKTGRAVALGAAFVSLVASAHTENALLYLTGAIWAAFTLYRPALPPETEEG